MIRDFFDQMSGTIFGLFNLFSGGALEQLSIFSLGIMPYISATIIFQLLTVVIPKLEQLKKEGEQGQKKDQSVVALRDGRLGSLPELFDCGGSRERAVWSGRVSFRGWSFPTHHDGDPHLRAQRSLCGWVSR